MSRDLLLDMARYSRAHAEAGTIAQASDVLEIPAAHYVDPGRWALEIKQVFRRVPLLLAVTAELKEPGDYKTMTVAGVPVLMVRHPDGDVRAFLNSCSHRGAQIMTEPSGNARQFSCPYHAWTYNHAGDLIAIYGEKEFGTLDKTCHGLVSLPVKEVAGLIWVSIDPNSPLGIDEFLCGYEDLLAHFGFETWHLFEQRTLEGPNWKIAYDGYLDLYHLPILHRETFGPSMSSQALYTAWGPHQRVSSPDRLVGDDADTAAANWSDAQLMNGVWTIFPHISIASFDGGGGRGVMLSQLFPGEHAGQSFTNQLYIMEQPPANEEIAAAATAQFDFLKHVVRDEDYATGLRQQVALGSGLRGNVMFGRNEAGGQHFHGWLDRLLSATDAELPSLFSGVDAPVVHGESGDWRRGEIRGVSAG
ncbi:MAG: aromatic ring-hydroxylating dioxygenase subunit alpha [Pseudomonadota bacterium]